MPELEHQGCRLHYSLTGEGPAVLLIQGVGVEGGGWRPQIAAFGGRHTCLSFDNRGIGRSQPAGGALSIEQFASDALALMDAAGWEKAHVVGHSMGGLIALQMALTARARVRSLALLCAFARGKDVTGLTWEMLISGLRTRIGPRAWRRKAFLELVHAPESMAGEMAELFGHDLADQPPIVMRHLAAMSAYDASGRLRELGGIPARSGGGGARPHREAGVGPGDRGGGSRFGLCGVRRCGACAANHVRGAIEYSAGGSFPVVVDHSLTGRLRIPFGSNEPDQPVGQQRA
ncbi:MAG: alpha/beta fold hydrolase [Bryobacterales bacterium]|nr:alpha/beta fold hydrolase [Bryobacterales bacterium]